MREHSGGVGERGSIEKIVPIGCQSSNRSHFGCAHVPAVIDFRRAMGGHGHQYFHADRIGLSNRAQRSFHPNADSLRLFPAVLSGIFGVTLFGIFLTPFFYSLLRFSKQRERNDTPRRTTVACDCASIPTTSTMRRSRLVAACR